MFKIIAETAFSHEGNFDYLKKQINAAKEANTDFVKFQVFLHKDEYIVKSHPNYNSLDKWLFSEKQWKEAFKYAKALGLKILALPLNTGSAKFCLKHDSLIDLYEIHSVCFNEVPLLKIFRKTSKKIVLGIGGRLPQEIEFALNILHKNKEDIILMYGFQSFPTDKSMLNLNKIKAFKQLFNCELGYADHNSYDNNAFYQLNNSAYLSGANYFEKHIVLEKGKKRIDFESAVSVNDFIEMQKQLADFEQLLGDGNVFKLNAKEEEYKNREKQIVAKEDIKKGTKIKETDLIYKISKEKSSFEQHNFYSVIGKTASNLIKKDSVIQFKDLR